MEVYKDNHNLIVIMDLSSINAIFQSRKLAFETENTVLTIIPYFECDK